MQEKPWVSFCISTFNRPEMLETQLRSLLKQDDPNFEIVISDNDPSGSGSKAVTTVNDSRVKYWKNDENLGMIRSFNKSVERAGTDYVVMVTDDDPVHPGFLAAIKKLVIQYPGLSLYGGFSRAGKKEGDIEIISGERFGVECLDPDKTTNLLWSSVLLNREDVLKTGIIPDYGSPHLADHALLARVGSLKGAVIVNKMYSTLSSHDTNFSKSNLEFYFLGCKGFFESMNFDTGQGNPRIRKVVLKHLKVWFLANFFTLRKYYVLHNIKRIEELDNVAKKILALSFMKHVYPKYYIKRIIFDLKKFLGRLK